MSSRIIVLFLLCWGSLRAAALVPEPIRVLTVAGGLPQSYISGLAQDSTGFVWIGTRDGLARYDGRRFRIFRHTPGDTAGLLNNTISGLYLDSRQRLWIPYETGDIDLLDTRTERVVHFTRDAVFKRCFNILKAGHSITEDDAGNIWMLGDRGGMYRCNPERGTVTFFPEAALGLPADRIVSIANGRGALLLATDKALVQLDSWGRQTASLPFNAPGGGLFDPARPDKNCPLERRKSGEVVVLDDNRVLICDPASRVVTVVPLPAAAPASIGSMVQDGDGNIFFWHDHGIYRLGRDNRIALWKPESPEIEKETASMLVDRSGVLWIGGNGTGVQLFELRLARMPALSYRQGFTADVLREVLQVPAAQLEQSIFPRIESYRLRSFPDGQNGLWIFAAGYDTVSRPQIYHYRAGQLRLPPWTFIDTRRVPHSAINSMARSRSGKLWGIDFYLRPVEIDTSAHTVKVYQSQIVRPPRVSSAYTVSSLLIEGEDTFWVSTSLGGLYRYDRRGRGLRQFRAEGRTGDLPVNQLMNMVPDPDQEAIMWIGSLGGGLIRFDRRTGTCRSYTTADGLPNNTVYAVMTDARGRIWGSSNKGLFCFDPRSCAIQSYTAHDGLPGDEFNRYHFLKLPDGRMAFGGVDGFTVFDPLATTSDDFAPQVALTGIRVTDASGDTLQTPQVLQGVNRLDCLELSYRTNFLTFEFAALQFNVTGRLRYRYMLEGIDNGWVESGGDNTASYTALPPGDYLLRVAATNTAGHWSPHVKTLRIRILPPVWRTWWAMTAGALLIVLAIWMLIRRKIAGVRAEMEQKARFEMEASELRAQALRAQMNPHFIFNCLNSIKALIQEGDKQNAVMYLTSFSKLIRGQLENAEREVSLHEELQTCRLYARMESLRFGAKISCSFEVDPDCNPASLPVPALILQPFIENAIWHGLLPKGGGDVRVSVAHCGSDVCCIIDDNGIGRELSRRNKPPSGATYESKGMKIAQNRMALYNRMHKSGAVIEMIDKVDAKGMASGTRVLIKFSTAVEPDAQPVTSGEYATGVFSALRKETNSG